MAHNDKPESANEAQDHSQPLDEGGFFSLNDVIAAGRHQLTRSEQLLAADTRRQRPQPTRERQVARTRRHRLARHGRCPLGRFWPR